MTTAWGRDHAGMGLAWARMFRRRLREPSFWTIQAWVLGITLLHLAVEAFGQSFPEVLRSSLRHAPVMLYLIPIIYGGLRYGLEGSLLTGAWCFALTLPNILVWHRSDYAWLGELVSTALILGVAIAIALPVEQERRQRGRLIATGRRLALLHEVASGLVSPHPLPEVAPTILEHLRQVLGLRTIAVLLRDDGAAEGERWILPPGTDPPELDPHLVPDGVEDVIRGPDGSVVASLGRGRAVSGALVAVPADPTAMSREDIELLRAVAAQIGVTADNERLQRMEREHLRSYVHEVTRAQEEERKRVARDLHDTVAQDMVLLARGLDELIGSETPPAGQEQLLTLRASAARALEALRRLGRDLRPTALDDLGLVPALEWLATEVEMRTGISTSFHVSGEIRRLPADVELALFRITQEALRNVERHAQARRASVRITFRDDDVELEVVDDGHGFQPPEPLDRLAVEGRLGLLGMRERAELVGGSLSIRSRSGEGTSVRTVVAAPAAGHEPALRQPPDLDRA